MLHRTGLPNPCVHLFYFTVVMFIVLAVRSDKGQHVGPNVISIVYDIFPTRDQNFNWYQSRHPNIFGWLPRNIFWSYGQYSGKRFVICVLCSTVVCDLLCKLNPLLCVSVDG